jgi:hypothetical protein
MLGIFSKKSNSQELIENSPENSSDETESSAGEEEAVDELLEYAGENFITKGKNQCHAVIQSNGLYLIKKWALNRHIDEKVVNEIKENYIQDIKKIGMPHMLDPIHVSHFVDEEGNNIYEIMDGQHRYKALYEIHNDKELNVNNFDISLEIHRVYSEEEKMELFDIINRRKQIDRTHLIDYKIPIFIDQFSKYWLENYSFNIFGINRPRMPKNIFEAILNKHKSKIQKYTIEELLTIFESINKDISKLPRSKQFGKSSRPSTKIFNEAVEKGFYLGLDKNMGWFDKFF